MQVAGVSGRARSRTGVKSGEQRGRSRLLSSALSGLPVTTPFGYNLPWQRLCLDRTQLAEKIKPCQLFHNPPAGKEGEVRQALGAARSWESKTRDRFSAPSRPLLTSVGARSPEHKRWWRGSEGHVSAPKAAQYLEQVHGQRRKGGTSLVPSLTVSKPKPRLSCLSPAAFQASRTNRPFSGRCLSSAEPKIG